NSNDHRAVLVLNVNFRELWLAFVRVLVFSYFRRTYVTKTMLPYVILYQLLVIHVSVSVYVEVPVFSKYKMPCNISHLPKTHDLQKFVWYQDGRINRAINEIILPYGEIPFDEITPDASGTYMCCYGTSNFSFCAEKIRLYVKYPRPKIFFDTFLNITAPVYTDTVYWLPQMLETPLEYSNIAKSKSK
ncbi:unnamed protein product, partial [Hymenolepis diminuta]